MELKKEDFIKMKSFEGIVFLGLRHDYFDKLEVKEEVIEEEEIPEEKPLPEPADKKAEELIKAELAKVEAEEAERIKKAAEEKAKKIADAKKLLAELEGE